MAFPITGRLSSLSITNGSLEHYLTTAAPQSKVKQQIDEFTEQIDGEKKAHQSSWTVSTVMVTCIALTAIGIGIFYILTHSINEKVICIGGSLIEGGLAVEILFHYFASRNIKNYHAVLDQRLESFKNQRAYLLPVLEDLDNLQCEEVLKAVTDDEFVHFVDKEVNLDYPQAFRKVLSLSIDRLVRLKRVHVALKFMLNANMTSQECAQIIGKLKAENYATFIKEFEKTFFANDRELTVAAQNVFDAIIIAHLDFINKNIKVGPLGLHFLENLKLKDDQILKNPNLEYDQMNKIIKGGLSDEDLFENVNRLFAAINDRYFNRNWGEQSLPSKATQIIQVLTGLDDEILKKIKIEEFHLSLKMILILTKHNIFGVKFNNELFTKFTGSLGITPKHVRILFNRSLGAYRARLNFDENIEKEKKIRKVWGEIFKFYREKGKNFSIAEWNSVMFATNIRALPDWIHKQVVNVVDGVKLDEIKELVLFIFKRLEPNQVKIFLNATDDNGEFLREDFLFEIFYSVFNAIGSEDSVKKIEASECLTKIKVFYDLKCFRALFNRLVEKVPYVYSDKTDFTQIEGGTIRLIGEIFSTMNGGERATIVAELNKKNCTNKAIFLQKYFQAKQGDQSFQKL